MFLIPRTGVEIALWLAVRDSGLYQHIMTMSHDTFGLKPALVITVWVIPIISAKMEYDKNIEDIRKAISEIKR